MAHRDDELFELLEATQPGTDDVPNPDGAGDPPLRVRPAVRNDHELKALPATRDEDSGEGSGSIGAVTSSSRRLRIRPAGLRASSADDRRSASGRLAPPSPPGRRAPHPRAVSGPPRREPDAEPQDANRSNARRRLGSSHGFPAVGESPDLDAILGDEPILVVDEMPPSNLIDASHGLGRRIGFRMDTVLVACFLGLVMLGVSFMLGRGSQDEGERLASSNPSEALPALSITSGRRGLVPPAAIPSAERPRGERREAPVTVDRPARESSPPATADGSLDDPAKAPRFSIMAMRATRSRSDEVRAFLEGHGLRVYLEHVNARTTNVRIGGYAEKGSEKARADLIKVQKLRFEGTIMRDAYFVSWKDLR